MVFWAGLCLVSSVVTFSTILICGLAEAGSSRWLHSHIWKLVWNEPLPQVCQDCFTWWSQHKKRTSSSIQCLSLLVSDVLICHWSIQVMQQSSVNMGLKEMSSASLPGKRRPALLSQRLQSRWGSLIFLSAWYVPGTAF